MQAANQPLDSSSVGEESTFQTNATLEERLPTLNPPKDFGRITLIVRRGRHGVREPLDHVALTAEEGVPGDAWGRSDRASSQTQLAVIQTDVAELIANGQPLALFGDNLYLDLDLSASNLPPGSHVRVGEAVLEVTSKPHLGCAKYAARFGRDALAFISRPDRRHLNLRGIYMRVVEAGPVARGDSAVVISRGDATKE
jgi:MOSC domain-containing protein YiiM